MTRRLLIISLTFLVLTSCQEQSTKTYENENLNLCDQIDDDSLITLKGTVNVSSKGIIVFENINKKDEWQRKIHLIPCSKNLKDYMFKTYDSYLHLKNFDDKFWVSVEGKYLTADKLETPQQFLFHFVALIDELEAITDSSQALREITREQLDSINKN